MVRRHLMAPVKYTNPDLNHSSTFEAARPPIPAASPSMARILPISSQNSVNNNQPTATLSRTSSSTTATIQINRTPKCQVRMTSKLRSLLLEGHKRDVEARQMMPPPPPPPPLFTLPPPRPQSHPPPTSVTPNPLKQLFSKLVCGNPGQRQGLQDRRSALF